MPPLTLTTLLTELERTADRLSAWQRIDPADPDHGGLVNPEFDLPDAKMDGNFVAACGLLHLGGRANDERLRRANLAADHLLTAQRPSGNIDLLSVNYDSAPDTAFTVQNLCHAFEIAQERESEADPTSTLAIPAAQDGDLYPAGGFRHTDRRLSHPQSSLGDSLRIGAGPGYLSRPGSG